VDRSSAADDRPTKKSKTSSFPRIEEEDDGSSTPKPEIQRQSGPALQVCRYLLEMFSVPLLRSHATVGLVDRDRLQLYHANRSVILVSSAINFSKDDGLDKFIAYIIALYRLSPEQNGILKTLAPNNIEKLIQNSKIHPDNEVIQRGNNLHFSGPKPFTVVLADVISRDPATIGRSTVVLGAKSDRWPDTELVVKISWPGSGRVAETLFLKEARERAEKTDGRWAIKHLPQMFYAEDVVFNSESTTIGSVAHLFKTAEVLGGEFEYEPRTLRVIIQERLYPLKSLEKVRDIGQVFLDVACSTYSAPSPFLFPVRLHRFSSPLAVR
jgi:hypothetical protein